MTNTQFFINYIEHFSYLGIFVIGALVGYVIPIPEEIFLLLVGYIAGIGFYNVYFATFFAILGVLVGDNFLFWVSRYKASRLAERLKNRMNKNKVMKYRRLMKKHIGKTIFTLKFVVGLRVFSPFLAGSMKIKWSQFQFYNLLAAMVYVPIITFLGFHFHNQLALVITGVEFARHIIFLLILVLIGFFVTIFVKNKSNAKVP